jgi:signal recognition particle GTPase
MKGVFVVGASGAGKTTLAATLADHYRRFLGGQGVLTANLDCANPHAKADIDVCELVALEDIMEECQLG